jgi:hypothetical protein
MQQWMASLSAEPQTDAAVGCGPGGGAPCGSPSEAAQQQAMAIAQQYCAVVNQDVGLIGCPPDAACNNLPAALAPYISQLQSFFGGFPASVWATEAANAASGDYYGPIVVNPNTSPQNMPSQAAIQYGPPVSITTGAPTANALVTNAPTAPATPTQAQINNATNQSGSGTQPVGGTQQTQSTVAPDEITQWLQANWIILAAAAAGLFLLGKA